MKRIRLFTWCWYSYFKPTKENTRFKLRFIFTVCLAISLLQCFTNFNIFWVCCFVILIISLMYFPKLILIGILLFILAFIVIKIINLHTLTAYADGNYKIVSKTSMGPIIKIQNQRVLVKSKLNLNKGDYIYVKGLVESIINKGDFDLKQYLNTKWVDNIINAPEVHLYSHSQNWLNLIHNYAITGPGNFTKVVPLLLLGIKDKNTKEIFELTKKISIVHLFVISGFHIGILYKVINWIFKKIKVKHNDIITLILILPYIALLNWTIPALRAFLFIALLQIKKKSKVNFSSLDSLSLIAALFLIYNPYNVNSLSYILTFTSTTIIIYCTKLKFRKSIKYFLVNFLVFFATLPMIIKINGFIPILAPIFSMIFTPIVSSLYILTIFSLPLKIILIPFFDFFIFLLKITSKVSILIKVNELNFLGLFIYYSLFVIFVCSLERFGNHLYMKRNLEIQTHKK